MYSPRFLGDGDNKDKMGCFIRLFCGIKESERRSSRRRQESAANASSVEENFPINDETLVYTSESACFRLCDQLKGNKKLICALKLIFL